MTQGDLAEALNISRSSVSMYENGEREPDFETLEFIADYFNVDMNHLLGSSKSNQEYDDDALELAQQLSEEGFGELNILFKKTGKLSKEEKERVMKILRATLPENGND